MGEEKVWFPVGWLIIPWAHSYLPLTLLIFSFLKVAVKSIRKEKIKDEQDLIHIRREIEIMSSLCHPHVITIYEGTLFQKQNANDYVWVWL